MALHYQAWHCQFLGQYHQVTVQGGEGVGCRSLGAEVVAGCRSLGPQDPGWTRTLGGGGASPVSFAAEVVAGCRSLVVEVGARHLTLGVEQGLDPMILWTLGPMEKGVGCPIPAVEVGWGRGHWTLAVEAAVGWTQHR